MHVNRGFRAIEKTENHISGKINPELQQIDYNI